MDFKQQLKKLGLNSDNCVVIGSGVLEALGIRESKDIDVVVKRDSYDSLKKTNQFTVIKNRGRETLEDGLFEIGTECVVLGKQYIFEDLLKESKVIDGVRYDSIDFLLRVKKSKVKGKTSRSKDVRDIGLIEEYIK